MSDEISVDALELLRMEAQVASLSLRVGERASAVHRKSSFDIVATAQATVPVDTGFLKGSIGEPTFTGDASFVATGGELTSEMGPTAEYGPYVEFGTSRQAPQAYMGPALDRHENQFVEALEQVAWQALP